MQMIQSLCGEILRTFEKERSEGHWNWQLLFQAYQLAIREMNIQGDNRIMKLMVIYYWEDLEQAFKRFGTEMSKCEGSRRQNRAVVICDQVQRLRQIHSVK